MRTFLDLTEEGEANLVGAPLLPYGVKVRKLADYGGEGSACLRLPIRDLDVLGCWLLRHGLATKGDVLATLARLRRTDAVRGTRPSPETAVQRELVLGWAELAS